MDENIEMAQSDGPETQDMQEESGSPSGDKKPSKKVILGAGIAAAVVVLIAVIVLAVIPAMGKQALSSAQSAFEAGDFATAQSELAKAGDADGATELKALLDKVIPVQTEMNEILASNPQDVNWSRLAAVVRDLKNNCPSYPGIDKLESYAEAGGLTNLYEAWKKFEELGDFQKSKELAALRHSEVEKTLAEAQQYAKDENWSALISAASKISGYEPAKDLEALAKEREEIEAAERAKEGLKNKLSKTIWCNYNTGKRFLYAMLFFPNGNGILQLKASNTTITAGEFVWNAIDDKSIHVVGVTSSMDTGGVSCTTDGMDTKLTFSTADINDFNITGTYGNTKVNTLEFSPSFVSGVINSKWAESSLYEKNWSDIESNPLK